jgi:hypothetical protein
MFGFYQLRELRSFSMATSTIIISPTTTFPRKAVEKALRDELIVSVRAIARRKGLPLPAKDDELVVAAIEIDSLTVVEILCVLDGILPFEVGESAVQAGGYRSIQEAVSDVVKRVEREWQKHSVGSKP